ncbi:MAG: RnfABCDGE type electron transport complex subunit G [Candidatus Caldatribacteriaceae bacterium]
MNKIVRVALALTAVCMIAALALSLVYVMTKERIAEEAKKELNEALLVVFPQAESFVPLDLGSFGPLPSSKEVQFLEAYEAQKDQERQGVVFKMASTGYGGAVVVLVGVDTREGKITGVKVLEHQETPGLGSNVTQEGFLSQFLGKSITDPFAVGRDIQAVSGATISSRAVTRACERAALLLRGEKE